ncbi:glycosyltransferase family 2 protein [Christiangramia fulva]|uniref:Glycosyltransferase family 2 protein n=1 Tax=Christiangramia fulva TaxID=2126553 RepID=A0A2R3Z6C4_9FLAO|nr:glycosyltransferase [Christiangramia fulva]AVR45819.1 glycosyltransferase family 2 protein [Christiangramia fulva]
MLDVSCIIINYNTSGFTFDCVKSIIENHDPDFKCEIIVIDNASRQEDFQKLDRDLKSLKGLPIKHIGSKINIGFGAGNMLGVQEASPSRYYAFINNDTLITAKNTLEELAQFMDNNAEIAVCSPQMLDEEGNFRVTIDHFSTLQREILKRSFLETFFPKKYLNRKKFYDNPTRVDYVQGSFLFVDAQDFNDVGGFDTNLFLYYEESDLCRRLLKQKGKLTYLYPYLTYIHYKSASIEKNIAIKKELKISLLYYIRKHFGFLAYKVLLTYMIIRYFFTCLVKPKYFPLFKVLWRGAHLSDSLKQKQVIIR